MGKFKFTFTNILFWVAIICSAFIFENLTFFDKPDPTNFMTQGMADPYFFMLFAIAMLCYLSLILYETIFNRAKINVLVLLCCTTLFVCGTIGIWMFNGMDFNNGAPSIVVDDWMKIKNTLALLTFALSIYSICFYFVKNHPSNKRMRFLFLIVILVVYFFIIYSIVTEYGKYEYIANVGDNEPIRHASIKSLFLNSNMFAGFILMGVASAIALNYYKKDVFNYITIVGFTIIQVFVCSLTGILITLVSIFVYFLIETILSFKKKLSVGMVKLATLLIVYSGLVILFAACQSFYIERLSPFFRFLYQEMSTADFNNYSNRLKIWETTLYASNQNIFTLLFGYGFRTSEYITGGLLNVDDHRISSHNGYLQLLMNFGVVGLAIFAIFVVYYFYCLIRLFKKHSRFALVNLVVGMSYFALSMTESLIAFNASAQGILIGALFYLPVITKWVHIKKPQIGDYLLEHHSAPKLLEPKLMVRGSARFILSLMAIVAPLFMFDELRNNQIIYYTLINAECILAILFISFPYLNGLWSKKESLIAYIVNFLIFASLLSAVSVSISYACMLDNNLYIWWPVICISGYLLLAMIVYSIIYGGSFKLLFNNFVSLKTSLGSLIGTGLYLLAVYFSKGYMVPNSMITYIATIVGALVMFYTSTFIVPFKDTKIITKFVCEFDANMMKIDVIRERLEAQYEI